MLGDSGHFNPCWSNWAAYQRTVFLLQMILPADEVVSIYNTTHEFCWSVCNILLVFSVIDINIL